MTGPEVRLALTAATLGLTGVLLLAAAIVAQARGRRT